MQFKSRLRPAKRLCRLARPVAYILLCCIPLGASTAGIYKWVDEEGTVHYGSQRPEDAPAREMDINITPTGTVPGKDALQQEREARKAEEKRIQEEGIPPKPPVPALSKQEMKERCQRARKTLQSIRASTGQLRERDAQGNIRFLSDQERQKRIASEQRKIREYCN